MKTQFIVFQIEGLEHELYILVRVKIAYRNWVNGRTVLFLYIAASQKYSTSGF